MQVAPGEVVGLVGPSGSGKSTLLKALGAVIKPTAGRMTLGGELIYDNGWKVSDLRALRRDKIALDLAGGNRRALEALAARVDYQRYQLAGARLTLAGNIVTTVISRAGLATQIKVTENILLSQEEQLGLTGERVRLGQAAPDEVLALKTAVATDTNQPDRGPGAAPCRQCRLLSGNGRWRPQRS